MSENDKAFTGSIPEFYESYLVPLIFEPYAADLATRVSAGSPTDVLEVAAGTGVVTRALSGSLNSDSNYVVTDLNQDMLDHARSKQGVDRKISWQQADALSLPFGDETFDVVVCQFGVMFFPDRVAGYSEARRVLKPDGKLIFNVWDSIDHNEFAALVTDVAGEVFANDPPKFLSRTPHGYFDKDQIRRDVTAAGFVGFEVNTIEEYSTAPSPAHPAIAYCQGTPLRSEIEARNASSLQEVTDRATQEIQRRFGEGEVSAKIQAHVITTWGKE